MQKKTKPYVQWSSREIQEYRELMKDKPPKTLRVFTPEEKARLIAELEIRERQRRVN